MFSTWNKNLILSTIIGSAVFAPIVHARETKLRGEGRNLHEHHLPERGRQGDYKALQEKDNWNSHHHHQSLEVSETHVSELVSTLVSKESGVVTSNVKVTGDAKCRGLFSNGQAVVPDLWPQFPDAGVVLSSGLASSLVGEVDGNASTDLEKSGDTDLSKLVSRATFDACVLEFDFQCVGAAKGAIAFNYVFGSEEYQEYVGTPFNDVFGFYLNNYNLATVPGSSGSPVSVNTINQDENAEFYVDNLPGTYQMEPDGFTTTLQAKGSLVPGINRMKLAVADTSDYILDSWVLIEQGSFECVTEAPTPSPTRAPTSPPTPSPTNIPVSSCNCEAGLGQQCCIPGSQSSYQECVFAVDHSIEAITRPLAGGTKCCAHPRDPTRIVQQHPNLSCPEPEREPAPNSPPPNHAPWSVPTPVPTPSPSPTGRPW